MNYLYDIYMKGNVIQCVGMGNFIIYLLRALFCILIFFQENFSIYFDIILVFVFHLMFTSSCG